ncbi:MAG: S-layer homology domain-containing protein [Peptococcaceae bacterium]|nr:S-layer homology domain-containing protein [Peptococcaceae bacterium]
MRNKIYRILLTAVLTVFCFPIFGTQIPAGAATFNDTVKHWSGPVVEKTYALELMKGYPGNLFKPEAPMSRLEAIAIIIRAMGLESRANTIDWKNSGIKLPSGMFWGQGHLVVAAQQGLIHKDYVQQLLFSEPITRAEVSTLVSLALKDKLKVVGDPQKLTFTDSAQISPDYKQFVANVTQNGIMQGITATEFGPNDKMKRGQMAALMFKTAQDNWFTFRNANIITGTISSIDSTTGLVTITKADGTQVFRPTSSQTAYFLDSESGSLADFSIGDPVLAVTSDSGYINYLENTSGSTTETPTATEEIITGKIIEQGTNDGQTLKIQDSAYQTHQYPLATAVVITSSTGNKDLSLLTNNQYVTLKIVNDEIQRIELLDSQTWEGTVSNVFSNQFVIRTSSGSSQIFIANESKLKILSGTSKLSFSSLKTGDIVKVTSVSGEAREVIAQSVDNEAEVRTIDSFYFMITLRFADGTRKEFEVETNASITKDDDRIRLAELETDDEIIFQLDSNGKISDIIVDEERSGDISGVVTDLTLGSTNRIYIDSERYILDEDVEVTLDGDEIDLEDIMIGAEVDLELNSRDDVIGIDVFNDTDITVEGILVDVNTARERITIEQSNDQEFTINVDEDCTFRDSTSSGADVSELGDLEEDWEIRITLEDGVAQTIRVLDK